VATTAHTPRGAATWRSHVGIPVRNLWTLLVYAADLAGLLQEVDADIDEEAELPDVLARLLATSVERRLRRGLSRGYAARGETLPRVRGRIDWLPTESGALLKRGLIACRFEDLTHDTYRNRLVRAALERMAAAARDPDVARRCGALARSLAEAGVMGRRPTRTQLSADPIARNDVGDRLMVAVATMALDLLLPAEAEGDAKATRLERDERRLRLIWEKAVANLYRHELGGAAHVRTQPGLAWSIQDATADIASLLPGMQADVIVDDSHGRTVIDTKFTNVLVSRHHGGESFKSAHIYQLYAYLRSQAGRGDAVADGARGILLHPSLSRHVDESVTIQGHRIRFATVDLTAPGCELRASLLRLLETTWPTS
jgi:5-methylcytosine-specific restriction enzyme subunit McrC